MPGCRAKAIQIRDLVKSRMPEIVEPKQLIQSRVLVKRARLTVKRGAARPNGKPKPPQSPLRRAVRYRIRGAARHSTQDYQRGGRGRGTKNEGSASWPSKGGRTWKKVGNTNHKETPQRATAQVVCPDDLCGGTGPEVSPVIELNQRQSRPIEPWGRAAGHFWTPMSSYIDRFGSTLVAT